MGDSWSGQPIEFISGVPKDVQGLRKNLLSLLNTGMNTGATAYKGPLAPGTNDLSLQSADLLSAIMSGRKYAGNRSTSPVMGNVTGGGIGGKLGYGSVRGGGGGGEGYGSTGPGGGDWFASNPPWMDMSQYPPSVGSGGWRGYGVDPSNPWQSPGGPGACFVEGTKILTPDGEKPIERIEPGDEVMAYDLNEGAKVKAKVSATIIHDAPDAPLLLTINDKITVTPEHLIYSDGWVQAGNLKMGDFLLQSDGQKIPVVKMELKVGKERVYNFELRDKNHDYFAGGILVHNAIPKDPWGA